MSVYEVKLSSLKDKLQTRDVLKKELDKVDDVIDKMTNPKKVKIISKKKK